MKLIIAEKPSVGAVKKHSSKKEGLKSRKIVEISVLL